MAVYLLQYGENDTPIMSVMQQCKRHNKNNNKKVIVFYNEEEFNSRKFGEVEDRFGDDYLETDVINIESW